MYGLHNPQHIQGLSIQIFFRVAKQSSKLPLSMIYCLVNATWKAQSLTKELAGSHNAALDFVFLILNATCIYLPSSLVAKAQVFKANFSLCVGKREINIPLVTLFNPNGSAYELHWSLDDIIRIRFLIIHLSLLVAIYMADYVALNASLTHFSIFYFKMVQLYFGVENGNLYFLLVYNGEMEDSKYGVKNENLHFWSQK